MALTEIDIARLLSDLPPAPEAWVAGAREVPRTRRELADVVGRIESDEAFRRSILDNLDAAIGPVTAPSRAARIAALKARLDRPEP